MNRLPERTQMDLQPEYHTSTGYAPVDAVCYRQEPTVEAFQEPSSGIILARMASCPHAIGTMTTAERDGDQPDLLFLSRGGGTEAHGKVAGTSFALSANRALRSTFVPRGADISISFGVSAFSVNLLFPKGYLAGLIEGHQPEPQQFAPRLFSSDAQLARLIRMLEQEIATPGFSSPMLIESVSRAIACLLARVEDAGLAEPSDRICLPAWKIRRVTDFVESNLDMAIGLKDLAEVAGLSTFHFSRVFKRAMGISPYRFVCERRLERARALLATDKMSIAELAQCCGFANQSHFTTAFSQATGMSPARFRQATRHSAA